jgi:hypothetical protein
MSIGHARALQECIDETLQLIGASIPLSEDRVNRLRAIKIMAEDFGADVESLLSEDKFNSQRKRLAFVEKLKEAANLACECIILEQMREMEQIQAETSPAAAPEENKEKEEKEQDKRN